MVTVIREQVKSKQWNCACALVVLAELLYATRCHVLSRQIITPVATSAMFPDSGERSQQRSNSLNP